MQRRVVSLWFPSLPADRMARLGMPPDPASPFAIAAEEKGGLRLYCLNEAAQKAGLQRGMALADARAVAPSLMTRIAEPDRDERFLGTLHRWAGRYSPFVAKAGADSLCLDITGCAHLFGGERAMLNAMLDELDRLGVKAQIGCADIKGAAYALARQNRRIARASPGETKAALADLPLAGLRIDRDTVASLNRLGFGRIGDLYDLQRSALARRFGLTLTTRLDQALGFVHEPVAPATPPRVFAARISLPEPIGLQADVMAGLQRLAEQLCRRLEEAGMGMRAARLTIRRTDHSEENVEIGFARPSREVPMILRLFERKLDKLDAGFGIELMRLEGLATEPLSARQLSGEPSVQRETALDELIARLGNRIGFDSVQRFSPQESHIPERAFVSTPAIRKKMNDSAWLAKLGAPRPLTLFPPEPVQAVLPGRPPKAISWRGRKIEITRATGPERITPEWWRKNPRWALKPKDYWRIEGGDGERLWLTQDYDGHAGWSVCGEFP